MNDGSIDKREPKGLTRRWLPWHGRPPTAIWPRSRIARVFFEGLKGQPIRLVTSEYVFGETATVLRYRAGYRVACCFGESLRRSQVVCEEIDAGLQEAAWQIFLGYADRTFSFTDCTSFALMRLRDIRDAFAFDSHFRTMGFVLHPHISG